jgi:hypothetical protein
VNSARKTYGAPDPAAGNPNFLARSKYVFALSKLSAPATAPGRSACFTRAPGPSALPQTGQAVITATTAAANLSRMTELYTLLPLLMQTFDAFQLPNLLGKLP